MPETKSENLNIDLNLFFSQEGNPTKKHLFELESGDTMSHLKDTLKEKTHIAWPSVVDGVSNKLGGMLQNIKIIDIATAAWQKYSELHKYVGKDPEETFVVYLAEHKITSEHQPSIEISVDGNKIGELHFKITISLVLNGVALEIQDSKITGIRTGACKGEGTLKWEDIQIVKKETKKIPLPGYFKLAHAVPITDR